jgi:hypothetical protein
MIERKNRSKLLRDLEKKSFREFQNSAVFERAAIGRRGVEAR